MLDRFFKSGFMTLVLCVVYAAIMVPVAPGFASAENFSNVLVSMLPLLIAATGQTVVLITAGIDLSVTSIIAIASIAGASLITSDGGPLAGSPLAMPVAVAVMVLLGCVIGLINGGCVAWLKMPPFIVTLTTMMFFSGLAVWSTQSRTIYDMPSSFIMLGQNPWTASAIAVAVAFAVQLLLSRTLWGTGLRAVGSSPPAARVSGVHVSRVILLAYVISGACAGLAAVLITGQLETGSPVQWQNNLLDVIGATVIGGTSLYGGRGSVVWTVFGVLLLTLIDNSLNLLNLSHFTIMMAKGIVILLAALMDTLLNRGVAR
jgi:ribose/xylose/arabinose/galactoside ABC-type transport system permease subunit